MDWKSTMAEDRAALTRIVALLLAFAKLAELAGSRSPSVRGFVLWVLFRAEAVAHDLVIGTFAPHPFRQAGHSRAEAMRLAARFRELAHELDCRTAMAFAICSSGRGHRERTSRPALLHGGMNVAKALALPTFDLEPDTRRPDTS